MLSLAQEGRRRPRARAERRTTAALSRRPRIEHAAGDLPRQKLARLLGRSGICVEPARHRLVAVDVVEALLVRGLERAEEQALGHEARRGRAPAHCSRATARPSWAQRRVHHRAGSAATLSAAIRTNAAAPPPGLPNARPATGVPTTIARIAHPFTSAIAAPGASGRSLWADSKITAKGRPAARPSASDPSPESQSGPLAAMAREPRRPPRGRRRRAGASSGCR